MPLNWKSVASHHVQRALEKVSGTHRAGIIVWHNGLALPAKEVLRVAYRLANGLAEDAEVRFSSGDPTVRLLSHLGFKVERVAGDRSDSKRRSKETAD